MRVLSFLHRLLLTELWRAYRPCVCLFCDARFCWNIPLDSDVDLSSLDVTSHDIAIRYTLLEGLMIFMCLLVSDYRLTGALRNRVR